MLAEQNIYSAFSGVFLTTLSVTNLYSVGNKSSPKMHMEQ
jgi:hypothetical protein